jgi:hypothetical protein
MFYFALGVTAITCDVVSVITAFFHFSGAVPAAIAAHIATAGL